MPFVAQNIAQKDSAHSGANSIDNVLDATSYSSEKNRRARAREGDLIFNEEQRNLVHSLGQRTRTASSISSESSTTRKPKPKGNCLSRSCSQDGRVPDVEPRDIKFEDLCKTYGLPGETWENLTLRRQAELLRPALLPRGWSLDPRSPYMRWWDIVLLLALVYTAVATPFEVALISNSIWWLFSINCLVDTIFIKDMVLQFFIAVKVQGFSGSERWIRDPRVLLWRYLSGWFALDFISVLPVDHLVSAVYAMSNPSSKKANFTRVLRILRLLKLARVLRASRVLRRWENAIVLTFSTQAMIKFMITIITLSHWMACAWALIGRMLGTNIECGDEGYVVLQWNDEAGHTWVTSSLPNGQSWITARYWPPDNPCSAIHVYAAALHFSVMTITSIGYGDVAPTRSEEYLVGIVCQLLGAITWAHIIGSACGVITNMNPDKGTHKLEMDELNQMLERQNISFALREKLRRYMAEVIHHKSVVRARELCQDFSPDLRGELVMSTPIGRAITHVWYFQGCDSTFLVEVAQSMVPHFFNKYEACDQIIGMLGICQKGAVARDGRIYVTGRFWGEDVILQSNDLKDAFTVISLTYSEVLTLSSQQLIPILECSCSSSARKRLYRAAMTIAVKKAIKLLLKERACEVRSHEQLHVVFEEAAAKAVSASSAALVAADNEHRKRQEAVVVGRDDEWPQFHQQVFKELRTLQKRCIQDFQALAQRVNNASHGGLTDAQLEGRMSFLRENLHFDRYSRSTTATTLRLSELGLPEIDCPTNGSELTLTAPATLAELSAQVEHLTRQLARLSVLPRPPPEPPPEIAWSKSKLARQSSAVVDIDTHSIVCGVPDHLSCGPVSLSDRTTESI